MKKKQKINKAVNHGEWLLLGLTALFLCVLFVLRERPAPARGISVRTSAARVPGAIPAAPASVPDAPPDSDAASDVAASVPDSDAPPESVPVPDGDGASESPGTAPQSVNDSGGASGDSDGGRVNLNTADAPELCALPGVGEALAARIIDYRETHGPFVRPEDVMRVAGIGEGKFAAMQGLITV